MSVFVLKDFPDAPDPISAVKFSPTNPSRLLVGSWNRNLYHFDIHAEKGGKLLNKIEHRAVILDCCWSNDENEAFTCGNDHDVRRVNLSTGAQEVLSTHEGPAARLAFDAKTSTLFSISWAGEMHIHNVDKSQGPITTPAKLQLPAKPFALAASRTKLVVVMSDRKTLIYDIKALSMLANQSQQDPPNVIQAEPWQVRDSSLKYMALAADCLANDSGYAVTSIEGRVAVDWFDESADAQAKKYAFKCHRAVVESPEEPGTKMDVVYPVHALAFNPKHMAFVTGGQDGSYVLWDAAVKRRVKAFREEPLNSVKTLGWNCEGNLLAAGICPGLESDGNGQDKWTKDHTRVEIREIDENLINAEASARAAAKTKK